MRPAGLSRDRVTPWLFAELPAHLARWLPGQRWFAGKARPIGEVAVEDVAWLPGRDEPVALVTVQVGFAHDAAGGPARRDRYALVVGVVSAPGPTAIAPIPDVAETYLAEVATESTAVHAVLRGLADETPVHGARGSVVRYRDATPAARALVAPAALPTVTPLGAEQSNTSVRVGAAHVFKLFRRLEEGPHPQLEVGRFLAAARFAAAPPLEGSLEYEPPGGHSCALGALEGWVANQGDGWSYVLARLAAGGATPAGLTSLADELTQLGAVTAEFHATLAGDPAAVAFAPMPVTADDVASWRRQAAAQAERTRALLAHPQPSWPPELTALADAVAGAEVGRRTAALAQADALTADGFVKIRIHGDYHLGQTLRTTSGFSIIDFEGEPARPLEERRQRHCALKDVAGMLRSFDYAAATATADAADLAGRAHLASHMRDAFLDGYLAGAGRHGARFLPPTPRARADWTTFFEIEKALYEVEYELNHRPSWASIPLTALRRLRDSANGIQRPAGAT